MAVTGAIYFTGAFALLVGGLYWNRASSTGACCALLCGSSAVLGLGPVQKVLALDIAGSKIGLGTVELTVVVMVVVSPLFPDRRSDAATRSAERQH